jgi:AraC-like DNA-binding protein
VANDISVEVRFYPPPADLRRYFTTFYHTRIACSPGHLVEDSLQPEWANLRFFRGKGVEAGPLGANRLIGADFIATGPSSHSVDFRTRSVDFWGIGLLPLGWSQFVRNPAADHANLLVDGRTHPSFAHFGPLLNALVDQPMNEAAELERIIAFFRSLQGDPLPDQRRILAIHEALVDPGVISVAQLCDRAGASERTVERTCLRSFGFSPKLLLRRQRFMRSLSQFMLDPSLKWIGAIDGSYHDQAQFVREFHDFMGMSPREYAARPHPVLEQFLYERARITGAPVQTMDQPAGVTLSDSGTKQTAA